MFKGYKLLIADKAVHIEDTADFFGNGIGVADVGFGVWQRQADAHVAVREPHLKTASNTVFIVHYGVVVPHFVKNHAVFHIHCAVA